MAGTAPALHLRGVLLPSGEAADLWTVDGRISREPVAGATTVADRGWILPGLVDLHCHVGLSSGGAVPDDVAEQQARTDRDAGVLMLRDAGSAADTRWMDQRPDLPRIVRAGRHLARPGRYIRGYGHEIEPDQLAEYAAAQARFGDGWVKLVGDWIDRDTGDLGPCWPRWALDAAIAAAHDEGARVTAHVFGEDALPDLLDAGIDCLEHGTGLAPDLLDSMARRGVALVPTMTNTSNFLGYASAGEARFPTYAKHMRALHERRAATVGAAHEAGVVVLAGTDAGGTVPHGLVGHEVQALVAAGLPTATAVGAASWLARQYLTGAPALLAHGDPADLVVLDEDPIADPTALLRPVAIVLRGQALRRPA